MPPFNFSRWKSSQITSGSIIQKDTLGLIVPSGAKDWLLYTFLTYRLPALIRLGETFGLVAWYKFTDEEKERLVDVYGQNIFYNLIQIIDRHIETCQDILSVFVGIFTGIDYGVEFFALNESKTSWVQSAINIEKKMGVYHSIAYLSVCFLYDVICMAIKRCLIKRSRNNFFIKRNILCQDRQKSIRGDLDSHDVSLIEYHNYNNSIIKFYSLSNRAENSLYKRFLEID